MFSKKNKKNSKSEAKQKHGTLNILGEGTSVEGKIYSEGSLRIDGKVNGNVECDSKLFIAETAFIDGDVFCQDAEICGKISGNVHSKGIVSIKETAILKGDIHYNNIEIEPGAQVACTLIQTTGKLESVTTNGGNKKETSKTA